jgi:3'-phosphoadenosine 5'-phosphosulfate sulfotransferase (PAPS reductase)/FAD synthetase
VDEVKCKRVNTRPGCVVSVSGGVCSAVALLRAVEMFGPDGVLPVFCDTKAEDADLHRFLDDCDKAFGVKTLRIADGRTLWKVARDVMFIPNSQTGQCSRILKRDLFAKLMRDYQPELVVYGFSAEEPERAERRAKGSEFPCWFPLIDKPIVCGWDAKRIISELGIEIPSLYRRGYEHNNCGGFCFKAGQRQFAHLLRDNRCLYLYHEEEEQRMRDFLQQDVSIMKDRSGGAATPLTMRALRERLDRSPDLFDETDGGAACDCMGATE